jgi:S1-C subfamily serine protease
MLDCQKERRERSRTDAASKGDAGKGEAGKPKARSGSGTGFFVSQMGHVVTNQHVVEGCRRLDVSYAGGTPAQATLVASDTKNDLAVLMTSLVPRYVPPFRPRVRVGESIYVYGFPLSGLLASSGNFTTGNITAVAGLGDDTSKLQISAPVQPGNSGGPLLDKRGNVVGMIVEKLNVLGVAKVTNDFAQNVNFAIKASIAETFLEANGIAPPGGERSNDLDAADIAEQSKLFTVYVACNRTP